MECSTADFSQFSRIDVKICWRGMVAGCGIGGGKGVSVNLILRVTYFLDSP